MSQFKVKLIFVRTAKSHVAFLYAFLILSYVYLQFWIADVVFYCLMEVFNYLLYKIRTKNETE